MTIGCRVELGPAWRGPASPHTAQQPTRHHVRERHPRLVECHSVRHGTQRPAQDIAATQGDIKPQGAAAKPKPIRAPLTVDRPNDHVVKGIDRADVADECFVLRDEDSAPSWVLDHRVGHGTERRHRPTPDDDTHAEHRTDATDLSCEDVSSSHRHIEPAPRDRQRREAIPQPALEGTRTVRFAERSVARFGKQTPRADRRLFRRRNNVGTVALTVGPGAPAHAAQSDPPPMREWSRRPSKYGPAGAAASKGDIAMRPLRYSINVTLDGCCHHEAGMVPDEESMRYWTAQLGRADALLFGRVTYQMMESAWRQPARGTWPDWMDEGEIAFAETIDQAKKYVVSSTLSA